MRTCAYLCLFVPLSSRPPPQLGGKTRPAQKTKPRTGRGIIRGSRAAVAYRVGLPNQIQKLG